MATIGGAVTPVSPPAGPTDATSASAGNPPRWAITPDGRTRYATAGGLNGHGRPATGRE